MVLNDAMGRSSEKRREAPREGGSWQKGKLLRSAWRERIARQRGWGGVDCDDECRSWLAGEPPMKD